MILKNNAEELISYLSDASNYKGNAEMLFIPENQEELKEAIEQCFEKKTPITISGAGTGLTAGRVPVGGAIISLERLNKIAIDPIKKIATCEPGVLLQDLQLEIAPYGLFYPPNPTEINSSIGGNAATNASGSRTLKYGATREYINKAKVLLANGEELLLQRDKHKAKDKTVNIKSQQGTNYIFDFPDIFIPNLKHSAGYLLKRDMDVIDLFIGSEGTLGVFSEIELRLIEQPEAILSGLVFFEDDSSMLDFIEYTREISQDQNSYFNETVSPSLLEYFDENSLNYLRKDSTEIPEKAIGAIWFEQEYKLVKEDLILEKWNNLICHYSTLSDETIIANDKNSQEKLRNLRHKLPLAVNERIVTNNLQKFGTDTAVPSGKFREYFYFLKDEISKIGLDYYIFGHIGNSHLHTNVFAGKQVEKNIAKSYYNNCVSKALELGGTVSAEHGIGKLKKDYLLQMYGKEIIEKMKQIKGIFDPYNLLGRGNLF